MAHRLNDLLCCCLSIIQGSDATFLEKLHIAHASHTYYEKPKTRGDKFVVKHYAGDVAYSTRSFLGTSFAFPTLFFCHILII